MDEFRSRSRRQRMNKAKAKANTKAKASSLEPLLLMLLLTVLSCLLPLAHAKCNFGYFYLSTNCDGKEVSHTLSFDVDSGSSSGYEATTTWSWSPNDATAFQSITDTYSLIDTHSETSTHVYGSTGSYQVRFTLYFGPGAGICANKFYEQAGTFIINDGSCYFEGLTDLAEADAPSTTEVPPAMIEDMNATETVIVVGCTLDEDCFPKMRESIPTTNEVTGVDACGCYANSNVDPFDECQGDGRKDCPKAGCMENSCQGMEAYCQVEDGATDGTCGLRMAPEDVPAIGDNIIDVNDESNVTLTSTSSTTTASPLLVECTIDDECSPAIRSEIPSTINATGASLCECYAASDVMPFDECEGDRGKDCQKDKCDGDAGTSCDDMEAYCQVDDGICALRAVVGMGNETSSSTVVPTSAVTKPAEGTTAPTPAGSESKGTSSAPPTPAGSESTGTTAPPTPAGSSESTGTTAPPTPAGSESATTTSPTTGRTAGSDSAGTLPPTAGSETAATTLPTAGSEPAASSAPSAAVTESGGDVSAVVGNPSGDLVSASSNVAVSYLVATFVVLSSLSSIMLF